MIEQAIGDQVWTLEQRRGARRAALLRRKGVRTVTVGSLAIGGTSPLTIQSMTTTPTEDVATTLEQIRELAWAGCQIVRLATPSRRAARAIRTIRHNSPIPLVADVHFDHRIALEALEAGVDKLRLNPGNLTKGVREVMREAAFRSVPIRVGVNGGSIAPEILRRHGGPTAAALVESATGHVRILEDGGFHDIIVSVKSSSVAVTVEAFRRLSKLYSYPLHVGVTEAGFDLEGIVKAFLGSGVLVLQGIGETLRVSLTGNPVEEVMVARRLLTSLDTTCQLLCEES